jgi:DNA topoisomerase-1
MVSKAKKTTQKDCLVVVESPAKARTLARILGDGYILKASQGHVRDLPSKKLSVDIEKGFAPNYSVLDAKRSIVNELKRASKEVSSIFLATDPDREGEAISWHIAEEAGWNKKGAPLYRVVFHEITREAVLEGFKHPRGLDMQLVNAQQTRRILDRLVGYQLSPLLWDRVQRGLSAGRVQSVALHLIVDREEAIDAFLPVESWSIEAQLRREANPGSVDGLFGVSLHSSHTDKGKISIANETETQRILAELEGADYTVAQVRTRETKQSPSPPFITSTLQQEAWRKLRFSAKKTMSVAQKLYEGVPLGEEGPIGLITYMRTDSTQVSTSAVNEVRDYIKATYGNEYVPAKPREFRSKVKGAQEAHEAIRPTSIHREPDSLKSHLSRDLLKLYGLIWARMLASQMPDALSDTTTADIDAACTSTPKTYVFRAVGSVPRFPGFHVVYLEGRDDQEEEERKNVLPELIKGMALKCWNIDAKQHFTKPPPRFTEASLVKSLEENGIGRPSTYAPIVTTIVERHYVAKEEGRLNPTPLGKTVSGLLSEFFPDIMDVNFTARLEERLDEVARGERQWVPMLEEFYGPFQVALERATRDMPKVKVEEPTDEVCNECGQPMVIKTGRFGRFIACSNYPECKIRRPLQEKPPDEPTEETCEKCSQPMVIKSGRSGRFMACSAFPKCRNSKSLVDKTPNEATDEICTKCGNPMVIKSGRFGRFLACTGFPQCRNTSQIISNTEDEQTNEVCDECGQPMAIKKGRYGIFLACTGFPQCRNRRSTSNESVERQGIELDV